MNTDKAAWGNGPWVNEEDRLQFKSHGFPCLMVRQSMGFWCGYIGVSQGHPWFGKDYEDVDVEVHGGLTYASHAPDPGFFWLGFDCAHAGDLLPARPVNGINETYRDIDFVRAECEKLAAQAATR